MEAPGRNADIWCMSEVDIFADLSDAEMEAIASAAPMRTFQPGELLYSPTQPTETLYILKKGQCASSASPPTAAPWPPALITPGTIFGRCCS